jgi:hypothetical protein
MIVTTSETWQAVVQIAEAKIKSLQSALERDSDEKTTTRHRASLQAYRDVLTWPEQGHHEESN